MLLILLYRSCSLARFPQVCLLKRQPSWNHVSRDRVLIGHFNIWAQQTGRREQVFRLARQKISNMFYIHLMIQKTHQILGAHNKLSAEKNCLFGQLIGLVCSTIRTQ